MRRQPGCGPARGFLCRHHDHAAIMTMPTAESIANDRAARLAAALRDNLRRRKAQGRTTADPEPEPERPDPTAATKSS